MVERFPLLLTEGSSSDTSSAGLKALTQPFKLRLTRAPGLSGVLKEYASNVVLIEPLASVAAIEDFLWPKVRRDMSLRAALRETAAGSQRRRRRRLLRERRGVGIRQRRDLGGGKRERERQLPVRGEEPIAGSRFVEQAGQGAQGQRRRR